MHSAVPLLAVLMAFCAALSSRSDQSVQAERPPRPQEPKPPFPYIQEEVRYPNTKELGVYLTGTLTRPEKGGPFPAVLLIGGAGPQDRDETVSGHKPFLVLSDYLTRRGIAVLRVDDRGTAKSSGNFQTATTKDFETDAEAGVWFLMSRSDVAQNRIGLIGHGEGAIIAPMLAVDMPKIAFIVLLAGTAVPGEDVLLAQTERAETAAGMPQQQIDADRKIGKKLYDMVRQGSSEVQLREALYALPEKYKPFIPIWQQQLHRLEAPWLRFFLSYNPASTLEKVKCSVLALDGEKDTQVVPDQNVPAMKAALAKGGNRDATVEILPGLNYMFQTATTGLGWEYATISETISPKVLETIGAWIAKHET